MTALLSSRLTRAVRLGGLVVLAVMLTGCIASKPAPESGSPSRADARTGETRMTLQAQDVERDLRDVARTWDGVPHEWGGTTRRGVDCSGLVQNVYADALAVSVPRTTESLAREGTRVRRSALQPGDLVFFRTGRKSRHVGVYLSDGEFVHASSSRGVMISRLDERYWSRRWWQARRVLPAFATTPTPPAPTDAPTGRSGW